MVGAAEAAIITTQFADLPDTVPGQDLWQGSYSVSGMSFAAGQGFTVYYEYDKYRDLASVVPPDHPGWDLLVIQPDLGLPDDGFFDGLALVANPSLTDPFVVSFVWLGGPIGPGQQPFEIYDTSGGFNVIGAGTTTPIPEPSEGVLVLGLVSLAGAIVRRFRPRNQPLSLLGSVLRRTTGRPR